jgi:hypothetical protein
MDKERKRKVKRLRRRLESIYFAVTGGGTFGEDLSLRDFPAVAHAVKHLILPEDRQHLADSSAAANYVDVDTLLEMLLGNCGSEILDSKENA